MVVLAQPAEVGLDDLLDLLLRELGSVGAPVAELKLEVVVILALEDHVEALLVGAVARVIDVIVHAQLGDRLALGARVLLDDLPRFPGVLERVGGYLVQGAQLLRAPVEEVGLGLQLVFLLERLADLLLVLVQVLPHNQIKYTHSQLHQHPPNREAVFKD